jgi:septal ring-binding cell division protein DamX
MVVGVLLVAAIAGIGVAFLVARGGGSEEAGPAEAASDHGEPSAGTGETSSVTSEEPVPTTSATTTARTDPPPSSEPGPGRTGLRVMPPHSYVLVLESIPHGDGLDMALDRARTVGGGSFVIDTSDHVGLQPGYFAVVLGPYASYDESRRHCGDVGRELGGSCYENDVTDPGDRPWN